MVGIPKKDQADQIAKALRKVQDKTGVLVATVITPVSDTYLGYVLLDTFLLATLLNAALWFAHLINNPNCLIIIQCAAFVLVLLPFYRRWLIGLLPRAIRHHHAARSAVMAFHHLLSETPPDKHVVLFYVSLAERYVHILHSRTLNNAVDASIWRDIVRQFTLIMPKLGLQEATLQAIKNIENALVSE